MPASTVSLATVAANTPAGPTWAEQSSTFTPGNNFDNSDGATMLWCRNTTAGAIVLNFYRDIYGAEVIIMTVTIPSNVTANGGKVLGPFPPDVFNDHSTTDAANNGRVMCKQATGANGNLVFTPFKLRRAN